MAILSITGQDVVKINERLLTAFSSGEIAKIDYSTDLVTVKTGKNGNTIYAYNASGNMATMELKVIRGSSDDKFLNSLLSAYQNDQTSFVLLTGEIVKRIGDGKGNSTNDTYILSGGIISKLVPVTVNVEGEIEQAISLYTLQFAGAPRAIS